jgi:Peptidase A4 family
MSTFISRVLLCLVFALVLPSSGAQRALAASQDELAIQDTIRRLAAAQAEAFTSGDPGLMANSATPEFVDELGSTNDDLRAIGVTNIELVHIDWQSIAVIDKTATATDFETWSSEMADGSTLESTDENDYRLVLRGGAWKVESVFQPGDSPGSGSRTDPDATPGPQSAPDTDTSTNWAGYAAAEGRFTAVSGTWKLVPPAGEMTAGESSTWVGIGGFESEDLIQAGTEERTSSSGKRDFNAWIEMLPQPPRTVPLVVGAGDSISVAITEQSANRWQVVLMNTTSGNDYRQTVEYTSSHSSAEWIQEAPSTARGRVLPLDNFGTVTISGASTVKDGKTQTIAAAGGIPITMVTSRDVALAVPSSLAPGGDSFSVTRSH